LSHIFVSRKEKPKCQITPQDQSPSNGFWHYADASAAGDSFVSTGGIADLLDPSAIGLSASLRINQDAARAQARFRPDRFPPNRTSY